MARGEIGQLRLSFTASALRGILPEVIRVFRDRYPDVQITMTEHCTQDVVEAFRTNQVDIGFLYPPVDVVQQFLEIIKAIAPITKSD